MSTDFINIF